MICVKRAQYFILGLIVIFLTACGGSGSSTSLDPKKPGIFLNFSSFHLSFPLENYNQIYSGYWALSDNYCNATGFAMLGLNGTVAELIPESSWSSLLGKVDVDGNLTFEERNVSISPIPLQATGKIDFATRTGYVSYQVACAVAPRGAITININMQLSEGRAQPAPYSQMYMVKVAITNLIEADKSCSSVSQCKILPLDPADVCNTSNPIYSTLGVDEQQLSKLFSEYNHYRYLTGMDAGTGFTICGNTVNPSCQNGICIKTSR